MSQEMVERLLGRLITDEQFRHGAKDSLEEACMLGGYRLTAAELLLLSGSLELQRIADIAESLDSGLCRASGFCVVEKEPFDRIK